jgi:hypothetical protein
MPYQQCKIGESKYGVLLMKRLYTIALILIATGSLCARILNPFINWDSLIEDSSNIIIARCTATPQFSGVMFHAVESDIEVISVLKGNSPPGASHMQSWYLPHQGERFLIFARFYDNSNYIASETYQIVPLNRDFNTNDLAGKTMNEQIQLIFRSRLKDIDEELARDNAEKQRIQSGLTMQTNNTGGSSNAPPTMQRK